MGTPLASGSAPLPGTELDRLRARVAKYFPIYETRVENQSVLFAVHVDPSTLEATFRKLAAELWPSGYFGAIERRTGEYFIEVARRPPTNRSRLWVNFLLLGATIASTIFTGALIWLSYVGGETLLPIDFLYGGLFFALPLLVILGGHELAHYFVARRYALDASLPYFLPVPPPLLFGTLGAFISIRQPFTDRKALFDIGAAGPIAGFAIAVPVTLAGLFLSFSGPAPSLAACGPTFLGTNYSNLLIGTSGMWYLLTLLFPSQLVSLHPLALAGWVGLFVTSINLLPAGQLDGGHVWRALLGDRTRYLSYGIAILLLVLGLFVYLGWLIFAFLVIFTGLRHPPPLNDLSPVGRWRGLVGVAVAVILVGGFAFVPVGVQTGAIGHTSPTAAAIELPGYPTAGNLSVNVTNQDVTAHPFVFSASVVIVQIGANSTPLNSSQRAAWASTSNWTIALGPIDYATTFSANATAPGSGGFDAVNAGETVAVNITYTNFQAAHLVQIDLVVSELCAPATSPSPVTLVFTLVMP